MDEKQERIDELFLARFEDEVMMVLENGEEIPVPMTGEMLVRGETADNGHLIVSHIQRLAWATQRVEALEGIVTLAGPTNKLEISPR